MLKSSVSYYVNPWIASHNKRPDVTVKRRTEISKYIFLPLIAAFLILAQANCEAAGKVKCHLFMYKGGGEKDPGTMFSPHDQIIVYIQFISLSRGEYTFHADWYNALGELQDTSEHVFSLEKSSDYAIESMLEMTKAGFLTRLFSASETTGYSVKFYGKWQIKLFLNGEEIADRHFTVR